MWEEDRKASAAQQVQQLEHREQPQQVEREGDAKSAAADGSQCRVREPAHGASPCGADNEGCEDESESDEITIMIMGRIFIHEIWPYCKNNR